MSVYTHDDDTVGVPPPKTMSRVARVSMDAVRILLYARYVECNKDKKEKGGVLLLRRTKDAKHFPGRLELPGGKVEADDPTIDYAGALEMREETGVEVCFEPGCFYRWEKAPGQFLVHPDVHYRCDILIGYPLDPFQIDRIDEHIASRDPREHDEALWVEPTGENLMRLGPDLMEETGAALRYFRQIRLPVIGYP